MALARTPLDPPSGGKARRTYETIVAATRDVVADTGALAPESVAERAGVSTATFYAYFSSKDDALAAAFDQVLHDNNERLAAVITIERLLDLGLPELLRMAASTAIGAFRDNELVFRLALSRLSEHRTIRDAYRRREQECLELLGRFIELGASAGRMRASDRDTLASAMLVSLQGLNNPILLHKRVAEGVVTELAGMLEHLLAR